MTNNKLKRAARYYVQQEVKGMIDHDISVGDMERAFIAGVDWQKERAIKAFRQFVENYCAESGRKDISEDSEHYVKVFVDLIS